MKSYITEECRAITVFPVMYRCSNCRRRLSNIERVCSSCGSTMRDAIVIVNETLQIAEKGRAIRSWESEVLDWMRRIINIAINTSSLLVGYYFDITISILIDLPLIGFSYWFNEAPIKLRRQTIEF